MKIAAIMFESKYKYYLALICGIFIYFHLLWVKSDTFSYDYINYLKYLEKIQHMRWGNLFEMFSVAMPYVSIPGGGLFEIGFVVLAKAVLVLLPPNAAYAFIATSSIIFRTLLMRWFQLEWRWVILAQIYAITLFEANALRAGVALTLTLWALVQFKRGSLYATLGACFLAVSQHLQAFLFLIPLALAFIVPIRLLRYRYFAFYTLIFSCFAVVFF